MSESALRNTSVRGVLIRALIILVALFLVFVVIFPAFSHESPPTPGPTPTVGVPATR